MFRGAGGFGCSLHKAHGSSRNYADSQQPASADADLIVPFGMTLELAAEHELTQEMTRAAIEVGLELEALAHRGVLTDECRSFPSDVVLEHASPGYSAKRKRLRRVVRSLALELFHDGTALLPMLMVLRGACAKALSEEGVRHAIQQVILAEISTACVAASYTAAMLSGG